MRLNTLPLLALLLAPGLAMAGDRPEDHPGYVDLAALETVAGQDANIELYLKRPLLRLVAEASRHEEPELAHMLDGLEIIQVRGFDLFEDPGPEEAARVRSRIEAMGAGLESRGWDKVARVRERGEHIAVYVRMQDEDVVGLAVMTIESRDETILVNIAGDIDPEQIGRIGRRFDIKPLDSLGLDRRDLQTERDSVRKGGQE